MANLPQSGVQLVAEGEGQFFGTLNRGRSALGEFSNAARNAGGGFNALGEIATGALRHIGTIAVEAGAAVARAIANGIKDSIGAAGDFEQILNVMGATSGATAEQLALVGQKAKDLGADMSLPATSAQDAAEVMLELSKAGFTVQEAMDAAKGALQLSSAAQVDAATAAQITAGALNAFGLPAADAVRVADLLAAGANASSASMTDLSAGLQQSGFAFNAAGLPVEDLITSLAALTNVGLTGSDSGTALKNALMRLMDPTDKAAKLMNELGFSAYDTNGNMKQLPDIIADLNTSLAGMTEQERNAALGNIFLSDGMKAMIPLLDLGEDGFLALKDAVTEEGAAADVANAQMQGWNGAVAAAGSQLETLQLVIGQQLLPLLTPLGFRVAELVGSFTKLFETFMTMLPTITSAEQPFRTLLTALVILNPSLIGITGLIFRLVDALAPLAGISQGGANGFTALAQTLTNVLGPLGATNESVTAGTTALMQIWSAVQKVAAIITGQFTGAVGGAQQTTASLVNFFLSTLLPALAIAATWFANNLPAAIATAQAMLAELGAFVMSIMPAIQGTITSVLTIIQAFWQKHGDSVMTIVRGAMQTVQGIIQVVFGVIQGLMAIFAGAMTGDYTTMMAQIQQANTTIWTGIKNFLTGILEIIAGFFGTSLGEIVGTWQGNFQKLAIIVGPTMEQARSIIEGAINAITGAFGGITGAIDSAIGAIKRFIDAAAKIVVPKLITPGSPTPLETGLVGIANAMDGIIAKGNAFNQALGGAIRDVSIQPVLPDTALPPVPIDVIPQLAPGVTQGTDFFSALAGIGQAVGYAPTAPASASQYGQGGPSTVTNQGPTYNMPIYTNQSPNVLQHSLDVARALAR